jgi:uncharacterized membrane protein YccC
MRMLKTKAHAITSTVGLGLSAILCLGLLELTGPNLWAAGFLTGYISLGAAEIAHSVFGET